MATDAHRIAYHDAFRTRFKDEFQQWFGGIVRRLHPPGDVQEARVTRGDGGIDFFVISAQHVYQVFAPARISELVDAETARKLHDDFQTAHGQLKARLRKWTFVHNHPEGKLGKQSLAALSELSRDHPETILEVLDVRSLWDVLEHLPDEILAELFPVRSEDPDRAFVVPHARHPCFVGREPELTLLHERAQRALGSRQAIIGLGGVGKTQLVIEYVHRWRRAYAGVIWLRSGFIDQLEQDAADAAQAVGIEATTSQDTTALIQRWLDAHEGWLLVLDNVDEVGVVTNVVRHAGRGSVIVTSRRRSLDELGIVDVIDLASLDAPASFEFMLSRTSRAAPSVHEQEAVVRICESLGFLPLALEQAAAYIRQVQCSFESYYSALVERGLTLVESGRPGLGDYDFSVATTWSLAIERIKVVEPAAADVLSLCALAQPDTIPLFMLSRGAQELGPEISRYFSSVKAHPLVADELVAVLSDYSMIVRQDGARLFSIHPLVQAVVLDKMSLENREVWLRRFAKALLASWPSDMDSQRQEAGLLVGQIRQCALLHAASLGQSQDASMLSFVAASYCVGRARLGDAEGLLDLSLSLVPPEVAGLAEPYIKLLLARVYVERGRLPDATELFNEVHEATGKSSDQETSQLAAVSMMGLAEVAKRYNRFPDAARLFAEASNRYERGESNPVSRGAVLINSAELSREMGKLHEARDNYVRAIEVLKSPGCPLSLTLAFAYNGAGELARDQGLNEVAIQWYERAMEVMDQLGDLDETDRYATVLNNLALARLELGDAVSAEALLTRARNIDAKTIGTSHPRYAQDLHNLGLVYAATGRDSQADQLFEESIHTTTKAVGQTRDVAKGLVERGRLRFRKGEPAAAEAFYLEALRILEQVFGPQHVECVSAVAPLYELYRSQRRNNEAATLRQRVDDFLRTHESLNPGSVGPIRRQARVGRNDPCPCGSGKKHKRCHGR